MEEFFTDLGKEVVRDPADPFYSKKKEELFKELGEKLGVDTNKFFSGRNSIQDWLSGMSIENLEEIKFKIRKLH